MVMRLIAGLLALEARAQLFASLAGGAFLIVGAPGHALAAITLFLTHDFICKRQRRPSV